MSEIMISRVDREVVERVARIMGRQSGAAKALLEHDRRSSAGEAVDFFRQTKPKGATAWVVGPATNDR